jgi:S-phase kinase-associated protein 1
MVQKWYTDFLEVDQVMLFGLFAAANFLDIKPLLDLTLMKVTLFIKVRRYLFRDTSAEFVCH